MIRSGKLSVGEKVTGFAVTLTENDAAPVIVPVMLVATMFFIRVGVDIWLAPGAFWQSIENPATMSEHETRGPQ